jgi:hypothetical protein
MAVLQGAPYHFQGPDGTYAVLNDPTDPNFVGYLTEPPAGIDGPPIRENAASRVDASGGVHGPFLFDRRPVSLTGIIMPSGVQATDEARQNKLLTATKAMDRDGLLFWTESVRGNVVLGVRTQQPTKIAGTRPKTFTVSMVSADHRIVGLSGKSATIPASYAAGGTYPAGSRSWDFPIAHAGNAPFDWRASLTLTAGSTISGMIVELFDASFSTLLSRTEYAGPARAGTGNTLYMIAGRPPGWALGDQGQNQNIIGDDTAYLNQYQVFHPLNWVPGPGTPAYGRITVTAFTGTMTPVFSFRDSWDQ